MSAGKGDAPRPKSVDEETFAERWERTFGKGSDVNRKVWWIPDLTPQADGSWKPAMPSEP